MTNALETGCAMLCLLTRAAWSPELPMPMTRHAVHRLLAHGALSGLVLRDVQGVQKRTLEHASALLMRTESVAELIHAYEAQGYTLLLPSHPCWPRVLFTLKEQAPLFLFAKGNLQLLNKPCLSVAGSRDISAQTVQMAGHIGKMIAEQGHVLVCGGARGVDRVTQNALLDGGGSLILVPAVTGESAICGVREQRALAQGKLLMLCETLPDEPFSAPKALSRNHTIYAMGKAAIVVAAREKQGGSWHGATDCLRGGWCPVYAAVGENADQAGCHALVKMGAHPMDAYDPRGVFAQLIPQKQQMSFESL